jgi:adenylate kinase family enzyme
MKIAIMGYSGSGKSTLAQRLGESYHIPVLYLDTVQFLPGWQNREATQAVEMVREFMRQTSWVIDGNYSNFLQGERLAQADQIIYLAFNRFSCLWRAWRRYRCFRHTTRESMADGCTEKMDAEFVWWILYRGRTRQKQNYYRAILQHYAAKTVVLKNQRQLDAFIWKLPASDGKPAPARKA